VNGEAAVGMTQQYVAGELSMLLARLQAAAGRETWARDAARLRRQAETTPLPGLASVVARALALGDDLCWDSLTRGDSASFVRQTAAVADLYQFSLCARLLGDR
jgi:hypothetical protein